MKRPLASISETMEEYILPNYLTFNQYSFHESARKKGKNNSKLALEFIDHVEESLNRRSSPTSKTAIDSFSLVVRFNRLVREEGEFYMQRWINYAINNGVKALHISYHTNPSCKKVWRYVLPDSLSLSTSLQTLDLFGCEFSKPGFDTGLLGFSLKELKLCRVLIDQETLKNLVEGCRFLEELNIELCEGFEFLRVSGDRLKVVDLYLERDRVQTVAVAAAPRLHRLSYGGGFESVRGSFMASEVDGVKEVVFHDVSLEVGFLKQVIPLIPRLKFERCCVIS